MIEPHDNEPSVKALRLIPIVLWNTVTGKEQSRIGLKGKGVLVFLFHRQIIFTHKSLENAVVLDGEQILNEGGFRVANECVNHKVIDAIGDMYTSGYPIIGRVVASKTGHYHNNMVLRALFADASNYEIR